MSLPFAQFSPSPLITRVTSRVTLLGFNFPSTDTDMQIFTLLISFAAYAFFIFLVMIIIINPVIAVLCSLLQFQCLMRAAGMERWPVFVCLWAKHHWLCCVRLSSHCWVKRTEINTASGSPESAGCRWQVTDRSEEAADCWSTEVASIYINCQSTHL